MPEPPIEIEPMTYALRETRSLPAHALAALIAQKIALTLAALGLSKGPVPRPLPFVTPSLFTVRNVTAALAPRLPAGCRCALNHAYRGIANCGKARQLGMALRHEQPVAG